MTKPQEIVKEPMQDYFGTTVNPGDEIAIVTTGYGHSVDFRKGVYLGYILSKDWRGKEYKRVKALTKREVFCYKNKATGELHSWSYTNDFPEKDYERGFFKEDYVTTLDLNRIAKLGS